MSIESHEIARQMFTDIINENYDLTEDDLRERVAEVEDEYGEDSEDFKNLIDDLCDSAEFFDGDGFLIKDYLEDFLESYGY